VGERVPVWGDASHLIDILRVRPLGDGRYTTVAHSSEQRPVVEGSQMLGQAIAACAHEAPGRRVASAHLVFPRSADASEPLSIALEQLTAGRTFTTVAARVTQGERLCATGTLLLDEMAPDVIRHAVEPPDVPGPDECEPFDMGVTGRDIRFVDGAYTGDPEAPVGPPVIDAWVRFRSVPDEPALHAALLAQFTGHIPIAAALRPHAGIGQDQAHRTLSTAINAISLSFHADVRADEWVLYHHLSTFAGDGMTYAECRAFDRSGRLLISFGVVAMVRAMAGEFGGDTAKRVLDERSAM
jgi:acyl-CoA thioesterase